MPIYEYRCKSCETVFELIRPMGSGTAGLTCPECGADSPEKIPSVYAASSSCPPGGFT